MKKNILLLLAFIYCTISMNAATYSEVFITGSALPCGWTEHNPEVMTPVEGQSGVFTWTGRVVPGEFKFLLTKGSYINCFNAKTEEGEDIVLGTEHELVHVPNYNETGGDHPFKVTETALYSITVNTNTMNMVAAKLNEEMEVWIIGSAVPGGSIKLEADREGVVGKYRYSGKLLSGDLKLSYTDDNTTVIKHLVPDLEDIDICGESGMKRTNDIDEPGWNVTVEDDYYKLKIDVASLNIKGEIHNVNELFIVGGATAVGWDAGNAIPMEKDINNPFVFTFTGCLRVNDSADDRNMFKLLLQKWWGPESFHPVTADEPIIGSSYITDNIADDYKWTIADNQQGDYRIVVNTFEETIEAEFLKEMEVKELHFILPTASQSDNNIWKYTMGGANYTVNDWNLLTFDDNDWLEGASGFGTGDQDLPKVRTTWDNQTIYLRKKVVISELSAEELTSLKFSIFHDEDFEIYINEVLAASGFGYNISYENFEISQEAKNAIKYGEENLFAVKCIQTGGGQYIDLGLYMEVDTDSGLSMESPSQAVKPKMLKVYRSSGGVMCESAIPCVIYIYNVAGSLVFSLPVESSQYINLPKGIYIIKASSFDKQSEETLKIII